MNNVIMKLISLILIFTSIITIFSPTVFAEESIPSIPDLSEHSIVTIDEIAPETTVGTLLNELAVFETETVQIYDSEGFLQSYSDFVGNGTTVVISKNGDISEVYKINLYGDIDCNGRINAADLVEMRRILITADYSTYVFSADTTADGDCDILDLVRIKKYQIGLSQIPQGRMLTASARFNWTNSVDVSSLVGYYENSFEDLSVVSNDIDLSFSRYYDSGNTNGNLLGVGWTASFEGSCVSYDNSSKIVRVYGQTPIIFDLVDNKYVCSYSRATLSATENGFIFVGDDRLTYTFNQNGHLISITDNNNNTVAITVDTNGKIQKVTDSVGREYTYTYGANGLLSKITDHTQRSVSYTYDTSNRLSSVTGVLGTVTEQYEYNSNNKLIKISDDFGNILTSVCYENNSGIISSVTDSEGVLTDYTYSSDDNTLTLSQNGAVTEKYFYNRYNHLTAAVTEEGIQQNFYCNSFGDIAVTENADGSKTFYSYDVNGNPTSIITLTDEKVITETNRYDANGNLLFTSSGNEFTRYTYDDNGNTLSVNTTVNGEETENTVYTYNIKGLPLTVTADGVTVSYSYDNNGYLSNETDTEGNSKTYTYNSLGWLECETTAETTANYKYALNGDTLRETKNGIVISRTVYDNYGRIKQQISETEYNSAFDGLDLSPAVDSYLNNSAEVSAGVRYYYGSDGKLSQIKASCYTVATDSDQKVTSVTAGNTVLAEYNYTDDAKELLSNVEYSNGQSISYNYDTDGNISALYYGDTCAYSYIYDAEGALTSKLDLIQNIRTDYAESNVTVSRINADSTLTELYSYKSEQLVQIRFPAGTIADPEFLPADSDEEAELERITESFDGHSFHTDYYHENNDVVYSSLTYKTTKNGDDAVSGITVKNYRTAILESSYSYSEDNIPNSVIHSFGNTADEYAYTYDENGNILSITKQVTVTSESGHLTGECVQNAETRYYYDALGQLVRVDDTARNTTTEYVYNGVSGNITAVNTYALCDKDATLGTPVSTKSFGYAQSGWTDLLTSINGSPMTYDALGNLLTYNGYTYTWEVGRRLTQMTNGVNTYSYKYDDNGIRTQKTINGVTTYYTTVDGRITGQYDSTNTLYFRYNAENSLIGFNLNGTEYIYLKNFQGDIEGILDLNGNLVVEYTYDAWGKVLSVNDTSNINLGMLNPMRYRGYYYDNETGYYYLQSRYYNPEICRFINADEPVFVHSLLDDAISPNLFTYCDNSPIWNIDSAGHLSVKHFWNYVNSLPIVAWVTKLAGFAWDRWQGIWYSLMNPI